MAECDAPGASVAKALMAHGIDAKCCSPPAATDLGLPVFARYATPIDIVCAWRAETFEQPVTTGGQHVLPDDHVLADRDGVILIGAPETGAVVVAAERKMATEEDMVRIIRAAAATQHTLQQFADSARFVTGSQSAVGLTDALAKLPKASTLPSPSRTSQSLSVTGTSTRVPVGTRWAKEMRNCCKRASD